MDIVEQLRKSANTIYKQDGYTFRLGLQNEAADEIERLQNVNKAQAKWLYDEQQAHKALRDKVRQWLRDDKPDILKESE